MAVPNDTSPIWDLDLTAEQKLVLLAVVHLAPSMGVTIDELHQMTGLERFAIYYALGGIAGLPGVHVEMKGDEGAMVDLPSEWVAP